MVLGVQVPDTPDCPRHVLLRRLGGGAQFCDRGAKIGGKLLLWDFSRCKLHTLMIPTSWGWGCEMLLFVFFLGEWIIGIRRFKLDIHLNKEENTFVYKGILSVPLNNSNSVIV